MLSGTIDRVRLSSECLAGNRLSDPVERELLVYLPPSYATSARAYPVLYVLTGFASTGASVLGFKPWEPNLLERYERLMGQGTPESILVMPDCFTRWGGSQFLDSPATGAYQRYVADEIVSYVDAHYRTLARRESRGVVGKSSGGFGALRFGMDRPERFAVVGSHAGDCAFELSIRPRFVESAIAIARAGGLSAFVARVGSEGPRNQAEFHAVEQVALAAAYAPDPAATSPHATLPFDLQTAMLIPEVWQRFLAHDPLVRAESTSTGLSDTRLVFLDAGLHDEYGLQFGARMLAQRLMFSGVTVHHEEFEGGHMGTGHRYEVSLPILLGALDGAPVAPQRERL
jgi:enterochelin esterase family protein